MVKFLLGLTFVCHSLVYCQQVILITGGARGVGFATAQTLAQRGYIVYAPGRQELDVTCFDSIQAMVAKIIEQEGRIDILINNAAYALAGPLEHLSQEEMMRQMDVNFFGALRMCQEVLPHMRKQQSGHIINISSEQGIYGLPYGSLYTASKAALESVSEALSIEVLPWNIRVSILEPGLIRSHFSIALGSKELTDAPYQNIMDAIQTTLQERQENPEILKPSQSIEEIATFIADVVEDPHPKLRYQTSPAAQEAVAWKLKDESGELYCQRMRENL